MTGPQVPYATPRAMRQAVLAHASNASRKRSGTRVDQLLRQFVYARLLARLPSARHSLDVDLWHRADGLDQAKQAVQRAAELDLGDHVRLRIGDWREYIDGNRPLARTTVLCRIGERPLVPQFGLDVVTGPPLPLPPEIVPPLQPLQIPGLPEPPCIRLFPLACSVADKLAATLTPHRGMPSTRYRDLVDLATIAITHQLAALDLHIAVHHELLGQRLPLPGGFAVPDPDAWRIGYGRQAQGLPHLRGVGFDEALALVKAMLDPVLAGRREGVWRPETRRWEPSGHGDGPGRRGVWTAS